MPDKSIIIPSPPPEHRAFASLYNAVYGALWDWLSENGKDFSSDEKQDIAADITAVVRAFALRDDGST